MDIPKEAIKEFRELIFKEYGIKYDDDEGREAATNLLSLFSMLADIESSDDSAYTD